MLFTGLVYLAVAMGVLVCDHYGALPVLLQ
jgi:hypothetical protein